MVFRKIKSENVALDKQMRIGYTYNGKEVKTYVVEVNDLRQIRESGEDYLEVILDIEKELGVVRSVEIARRLSVSRASVSKALNVLRENGLVEPSYYGDVVLTEAGHIHAEAVRRRHDLLYTYLTRSLGVSPENAEQDACRMEHVVSEEMIERIAALLEEATA